VSPQVFEVSAVVFVLSFLSEYVDLARMSSRPFLFSHREAYGGGQQARSKGMDFLASAALLRARENPL